MSDFPAPELRISDAERETAIAALGEHMSAGRLDINEYGDRSAQVATARTRGELVALFTDLPEPHPTFGAITPVPAKNVEQKKDHSSVLRKIRYPVVALSWMAAIALSSAFHAYYFIFIAIGVSILVSSLSGDDWDHWGHDRRHRRRELRNDFRNRRRELPESE